MEELTLETYPPMFSDYDNNVENENYDDELRMFTVSKDWAVKWIANLDGMTFDEFLDEYTWDDTFQMYSDAVKEGALIRSWIVDR